MTTEQTDRPTIDEIIGSIDTSYVYRYSEYQDAPELNQDVYWSSLYHREGKPEPTDYYVPSILSGGDYSSSCAVEASNHRLFLQEFGNLEGVHSVYGGYGSYGVAIRIDCITREMIDTFSGLDDYPCIDDEDVSNLEMEWTEQSWSNWVESDYRRALRSHFDSEQYTDEQMDAYQDALDDLESDKLRNLFEETAGRINEYWQCEQHESMYIDVDRIAAATDIPELMALLKPANETESN